MSENSYSLTLSGGGNSLVITDENSQHALTVGEGSALSLSLSGPAGPIGLTGPAGSTDFADITGESITLNQTFSLTAGSTVQTYSKVGSIIFKSGNYSSENTYELPNESGVFVVTSDGTIPTPESSEGGNWFDDAGKLLKFGSDGGVSVASVNVARTASKGSYLTDFGLEFWVDGLAYNEIRLQPPSVLTSDYYLTLPKSNATLATTTQADGSIGVGNVTGLQTALNDKQPLSSVLTATTASFTTAKDTKLDGINTRTQSDTAPISPTNGDQWLRTTTNQLFERVDSQWVEISIPSGLVTDLGVYVGKTGPQTLSGQIQLTGQAAIDDSSAMTLGLANERYGGPVYFSSLATSTSYTNDATGTTIVSVTLPAGTYLVEAFCRFTASSTNCKITPSITGASGAKWTGYRGSYSNGGAPSRISGSDSGPTGGGPWGSTSNTENHERGGVLNITGTCTYALIASQNTASATTTTVASGAFIVARKIA